jgi:hypothetical protein
MRGDDRAGVARPRLADQVAPIAAALAELDTRRKELLHEIRDQEDALKAQAAEIVQAAGDRPAEEIAEVYWRFENVPVAALGGRFAVQAARDYPWWSWRCGCGAEVFIGSRTELFERRRPGGYLRSVSRCDDCQLADQAEWAALDDARRDRERQLATMPYREYLQTGEWQEHRKSALKRARWRCQVCNRDRTLHVHHRTYERRGRELARDLIVLCDDCHALYHGKGLLASDPERGEP